MIKSKKVKVVSIICLSFGLNVYATETPKIAIDKRVDNIEVHRIDNVVKFDNNGLEELKKESAKKELTIKDINTKKIKKVETDSFEEVKKTGSSFWNSVKKYSSEKYDNSKKYINSKYKEYSDDTEKKEVKKVESKKVSFNDNETCIVKDKNDIQSKKQQKDAKTQAKKEGMWQGVKEFLDPEAINIRKGEKPIGKSIGN